jgi:hypothetical protein
MLTRSVARHAAMHKQMAGARLEPVAPRRKDGATYKQVIGYCGLLNGAVISQLGLRSKNDLAWQYSHYDKLVEMLHTEFELEKRIEQLQDTISVTTQAANTFISFQHTDKSHTLEWAVIILISLEIVVSLTDMYINHGEMLRAAVLGS